MRILVHGAGVLGCELTHCLAANLNGTALIAAIRRRHSTPEAMDLRICHGAQRKGALARPRAVHSLSAGDVYDAVFVVAQSSQVVDMLLALAKNASTRFVFVGNHSNACAREGRVFVLSARNV